MSLWGGDNHDTFNYKTLKNPKLADKQLDKQFMSMFMGLLDGDGWIEIGPQKQYIGSKSSKYHAKTTIRIRFGINLHSRDSDMLINISKVLGTGSISQLKTKNQTRLLFYKRDLVVVILPLIKQYNLTFLTHNRLAQYTLLTHILENNIIHWEDVEVLASKLKTAESVSTLSCNQILNLDFFINWIVGFTIAEGSFFLKNDGSYYYQIKQKGLNNSEILKAICLTITGREAYPMKADRVDAYQLSLSSINDIQKVVNFFSDPNNHSLLGYKLKQYEEWLQNLKGSKRYGNIKY